MKISYQIQITAMLFATFLASCNSGDSSPTDTSPVSTAQIPQSDEGETGSGETGPGVEPPYSAGSELGQLVTAINGVVELALVDINQKIRGGELLNSDLEQCIGAFDPALGESILEVDCDQPLVTNEIAIFVHQATLADTDECHAGMAVDDMESCELRFADITIPVQWEVAPGARRPYPLDSAIIQYDLDAFTLTLENIEGAITGAFYCEVDLSTGNPVATDRPGNCSADITRIRERLNFLLTP